MVPVTDAAHSTDRIAVRRSPTEHGGGRSSVLPLPQVVDTLGAAS